MNQALIPDEIRILLDCLQTRSDLELDEMRPLREWAEEAPRGELAISQAFAKNLQLESALQDIEISVPKTLEREVSSYVQQNVEATEEDETSAALLDRPKPTRLTSRTRFIAGTVAGIAAVVLIGASLIFVSGLYRELNAEQVAEKSIEWLDTIDKNGLWHLPTSAQINQSANSCPEELLWSTPFRVAEWDTKFGSTTAYEIFSKTRARGVLFVFNSSKSFKHEHIGMKPDLDRPGVQVGIGKNGSQVSVLVVKSNIRSDYDRFLTQDYRTVLALLLRTVWHLC